MQISWVKLNFELFSALVWTQALLKFKTIFFNQRMLSVAFLNIVFSSLAAKTILLIFTVCNLCETSGNVLSQTHHNLGSLGRFAVMGTAVFDVGGTAK